MAAAPLFVGLDLDYTALDTDKFFYDNVLVLLCELYPQTVEHEAFVAGMDNFRRSYGPANEYDLFAQLESLGIDPLTAESQIEKALRARDVLNPGVSDFLSLQQRLGHDVQIITIGGDRYQQLKKRCIPALDGIAMRVIREPKGAYLAREFGDCHGFMIDDKLLVDLPPSIQPLYVRSRKSQDLPQDFFNSFGELMASGPTELVG